MGREGESPPTGAAIAGERAPAFNNDDNYNEDNNNNGDDDDNKSNNGKKEREREVRAR